VVGFVLVQAKVHPHRDGDSDEATHKFGLELDINNPVVATTATAVDFLLQHYDLGPIPIIARVTPSISISECSCACASQQRLLQRGQIL
jgi:hypothetical protein